MLETALALSTFQHQFFSFFSFLSLSLRDSGAGSLEHICRYSIIIDFVCQVLSYH